MGVKYDKACDDFVEQWNTTHRELSDSYYNEVEVFLSYPQPETARDYFAAALVFLMVDILNQHCQ